MKGLKVFPTYLVEKMDEPGTGRRVGRPAVREADEGGEGSGGQVLRADKEVALHSEGLLGRTLLERRVQHDLALGASEEEAQSEQSEAQSEEALHGRGRLGELSTCSFTTAITDAFSL